MPLSCGQILLASSKGQRPSRIAANLGCAAQTVRNAIKAQLALTDNLIDQVVYRPCGLTEEAIGVMEGHSGARASEAEGEQGNQD